MKEFDLIDFIKKEFGGGIGDDCAVFKNEKNVHFLVSTDSLVENVHFTLSKTCADDLAFKSLAVNLSDLAAMGGRSHSFYLSLFVPPSLGEKYLLDYMMALKHYALQWQIPLLGGNTTRSERDLIISITIIGTAEDEQHLRYRALRSSGDLLCVTGPLGLSRAGLNLLQHGGENSAENNFLIQHHFRPPVRLSEGQFLASSSFVTSMMDISDGLSGDLRRFKEASTSSLRLVDLGVKVDLSKMPIHPLLEKFCEQRQLDPYSFAFQGGEDYELLFAVKKEGLQELQKSYRDHFSCDFFVIGEVVDATQDNLNDLKFEGHDHFLAQASTLSQ